MITIRKGLAAAGLLAAALFAVAAPATAGQCPADKVVADGKGQKPGATTPKGVTDNVLATIDLVRDHLNPRLAIDGVVLTMADGRTNLSADVAAEARRHLGRLVYGTVIPRSVRLSEAPSHGLPIDRYAPGSRGAMAYEALASEFRLRRAEAGRPQAVVA